MQASYRSGWRRTLSVFACLASVWLTACGGGSSSEDDEAGGSPAGPGSPGGGDGAPVVVAPAAATLRIHYQRQDGDYSGWGVYAWTGVKQKSEGWPGEPRHLFATTNDYGRYVDVPLDIAAGKIEFLLNKPNGAGGADKDGDCDRSVAFAQDIATRGQQVWLKQGDCAVYADANAASGLSLGTAKALWLARGTLVWPGAALSGSFRLHHAAAGGMQVSAQGVSGADGSIELAPASLSEALRTRFGHLADAPAFALPAGVHSQVPSLLKGQLVLTREQDGKVVGATQVQIQGVLDDVYAATAAPQVLGVSFAGDGAPTFRLWAPTAWEVTLKVQGGPTLAMQPDPASGVWQATGDKAWTGNAYYTYAVTVYSRTEGAVVTHEVTDPYAVTLNTNGQAALVADLAAPELKPAGWDGHAVPPLDAPEDSVLYELHMRDFSVNDPSVPAADRGKYKAFAASGSQGMTHLKALAGAGLTHVHLLPVFDVNTVKEDGCSTPQIATPTSPVSEAPQKTVTATKETDCFNWGYDPRHYAAPEGSYASDAADGRVRVREFRQMVKSLHDAGLRVVMDVVYNHTSGNFLDKIVPGYYYRLNTDGVIERSTCCDNTAPEFAMMEKLMLDTLQVWARHYAIDGFRFDIMGHLPKRSMLKAKAAADAAAGRSLYYYGEAWNFGEVVNDRLFVQARQAQLAGSGIGSFSDRIRDSLRGGGPFDVGVDMMKHQGYATGLCYANNELNEGSCTAAQRAALQAQQQLIRLGMAGNLRDYVLNGKPGSEYDYGGQPAGYTDDPQEVINYAGVHDGETLFDISQYKHPLATPAAERARAQVVALGAVLMGQGVPFLHAGDELLRSKSFDRDSYNSGDWFNRIDWTASTNYFGEMGLPPAEKNEEGWALMQPLLANANVKPTTAQIAATRDAVKDLLRVRKDTTLFRLRTGAEVKGCVSFPDAAEQKDGLIVMRIAGRRGDGGACGDAKYRSVLVFVNAAGGSYTYAVPGYAGKTVQLHPVLASGSDARVKTAAFNAAGGTFTVPARTVAVFVEP
ncbi:pullulanase-type alpha-1,6-glucosidase [Caldimonas brevitalea]|uniref:pullulanase n=1 Tax=Caldimonas brevitalea TaxID=413882 RepID=A0A0G3BQ16_9BURK|nr:pullulanase-type alpha-1,6-glucosidase [Caldimonas brevitalea]AKJ31519.1 neopullulanase [Caldimonas brevitalea]